MPAALERCVRHVMAQGKSEDSAWAICNASGAGKLADAATDGEIAKCVGDYEKTQKVAAPTRRKVMLSVPFHKIDEERREVWGYATVEGDEPDRQNDITEMAGSKKAFEAWSGYFQKISGGQSMGNIREMHRPSAVGKAVGWEEAETPDGKPAILLGMKIVDDAAWDKTKARVYNGLSIGANPTKEKRERRKGRMVNVIKEYELVEVSLVDNPANPEAVLTMVKSADGTFDEDGHDVAAAAREKEAAAFAAGREDLRDRFGKLLAGLRQKQMMVSETPSIMPALQGLEAICRAIDSELFEAMATGAPMSEAEKGDVAVLVAAAESMLEFVVNEFREVVRAVSAPEGTVTKEAQEALHKLAQMKALLTPTALQKVLTDEDTRKNLSAMHEMGHALTDATGIMGAACAKGICKEASPGEQPPGEEEKPPAKGEEPKKKEPPSEEEKVAGAGTTKGDAGPDLAGKTPGAQTPGPDSGKTPGSTPGASAGSSAGTPEGTPVTKVVVPEVKKDEANPILQKLHEVGASIEAAVTKAVGALDERVKRIEEQPASIGRPVAPAVVEKTIGGAGGAAAVTPQALSAEIQKLADEETDPVIKQKLAMQAATLSTKAIHSSATPLTRRS